MYFKLFSYNSVDFNLYYPKLWITCSERKIKLFSNIIYLTFKKRKKKYFSDNIVNRIRYKVMPSLMCANFPS